MGGVGGIRTLIARGASAASCRWKHDPKAQTDRAGRRSRTDFVGVETQCLCRSARPAMVETEGSRTLIACVASAASSGWNTVPSVEGAGIEPGRSVAAPRLRNAAWLQLPPHPPNIRANRRNRTDFAGMAPQRLHQPGSHFDLISRRVHDHARGSAELSRIAIRLRRLEDQLQPLSERFDRADGGS